MYKNGKATLFLIQEVMKEVVAAKQNENTKEYATQLEKKINQLQELSMHLMGVAQTEGVEAYLSDATLYLELVGTLVMCWQWLKIGNIVNNKLPQEPKSSLLLGKLKCMEYYFEYELPKTEGLFVRLKSKKRTTIQMTEELF
jgi:hypothetical protein